MMTIKVGCETRQYLIQQCLFFVPMCSTCRWRKRARGRVEGRKKKGRRKEEEKKGKGKNCGNDRLWPPRANASSELGRTLPFLCIPSLFFILYSLFFFWFSAAPVFSSPLFRPRLEPAGLASDFLCVSDIRTPHRVHLFHHNPETSQHTIVYRFFFDFFFIFFSFYGLPQYPGKAKERKKKTKKRIEGGLTC